MTQPKLKDLLESFPGGLSPAEVLTVTQLNKERLQDWHRRWRQRFGFDPKPPAVTAAGARRRRGKGRSYTVDTAMLLAVMRGLADAGLPIDDAIEQSGRFCFLVKADMTTGLMISDEQTPLEALETLQSGDSFYDWTKRRFEADLRRKEAEYVAGGGVLTPDVSGENLDVQFDRRNLISLALILPKPPDWEGTAAAAYPSKRFLVYPMYFQDEWSDIGIRSFMRSNHCSHVIIFNFLSVAVDFLIRLADLLATRERA
jgi:hypothetical protein